MAKDHIEIINLKKRLAATAGTIPTDVSDLTDSTNIIPHDFLDLTDTPVTYVGQALKLVRVNAGASALEFVTLSVDQTRINDALNTTYVDTDSTANCIEMKGNGATTAIIAKIKNSSDQEVLQFNAIGDILQAGKYLFKAVNSAGIGGAGALCLYIGTNGIPSNVSNYGIFIGDNSGLYSNAAVGCVCIGSSTGYRTTGDYNVFIGYGASLGNTTGAYNVYLGYASGGNNGYPAYTTSNNIFIGSYSGYNQENVSNKLLIGNQNYGTIAAELTNSILNGTMAASPANQDLRINAKLCVNVAPLTNMVAGDIVLEGGSLIQKPITTPTADAGYFKIYGKTDNKTYYQDTVGTEHEVVPLDLLPGYIIAYS